MSTSHAVVREIRKYASPGKAKACALFFKTKRGAYGFGDVFLGATVPEQRRIAKQFADLPLGEIAKLLQSKIHECRLTGLLILIRQFENEDAEGRDRIGRFYLARKDRVNNWDLVDASAPYILGPYLYNKDRKALYALARSPGLWDRRIAILATFAFIRENEFADTLLIAKLLLRDTHDLIHKATGWMLREVGNRSLPALERFLERHAGRMPRTALRYAIEKFPEKKRISYLAIGKNRSLKE